ncbi:hypothetical protein DPMN_039121 [Dreissena polymorpha]|uniref:Uncharacterized protein n=1 Tax=Dreissena polymorpha TaxID=45954 RepID=A0A9D4MGL9_DREPO|nr:hypothetical protein DPMN_039121 [Dreissena polymorpha]
MIIIAMTGVDVGRKMRATTQGSSVSTVCCGFLRVAQPWVVTLTISQYAFSDASLEGDLH